MEGAVQSFINWGGMWRELFGALINKEGYGGSYLKLLYWRRDIIRGRGSCLELL